MVNFGLLAAEIDPVVLGAPANFNGFRALAALLHVTRVLGVSHTAALNRGRHLYSAGWPPRWALAHILVLSSFFFSSTNLSGRRLGVYHTFTHGVVASVQIWNAGMKCTERGLLKIQNAKNRHLGTIAQLCRAVFLQLRHVSTIGKKLVKQQYLLHMSS